MNCSAGLNFSDLRAHSRFDRADRAEGHVYVGGGRHDRAEGLLYVQESMPDRAEGLAHSKPSHSIVKMGTEIR